MRNSHGNSSREGNRTRKVSWFFLFCCHGYWELFWLVKEVVIATFLCNVFVVEVTSLEWEVIQISEQEEDLIHRMHRLVGDRFYLILSSKWFSLFLRQIRFISPPPPFSFRTCFTTVTLNFRWDLIAGRIPGRTAIGIERFWILKHGSWAIYTFLSRFRIWFLPEMITNSSLSLYLYLSTYSERKSTYYGSADVQTIQIQLFKGTSSPFLCVSNPNSHVSEQS